MTWTDTGPDTLTRRIVVDRAGNCCELCGLWAVGAQIHHRRPRGIGGSSDPAINAASNLVLFCFDCHTFVERIERESAYRYGWLVPDGTAPGEHPFLLLGRWVFLDDHGRYVDAPDLSDEDDSQEELF